MIEHIIRQFGFSPERFAIQKIGSGLINHTWKVFNDDEAYILQRINSQVFRHPEEISENLRKIAGYLKQRHPSYLFVSPLILPDGTSLLHTPENEHFRLFPFIRDSITLLTVENESEAYEAASQFGRFTRLLKDFPVDRLAITLPDFHNLALRSQQFESARETAAEERLSTALHLTEKALKYQGISARYSELMASGVLPKRVIHHDTKISNVLFNDRRKGLCVIDLDTVMPGYFISDVGDMMRTYLSPANEESENYDSITVRTPFFKAIVAGYLAEMGEVLMPEEKQLFVYSGKFMIYMQAIRFLTDYLNGDKYYGAAYPAHNLVRAGNQFTLLERYMEKETMFEQIAQDLCYAGIQS
ncbi:phosphotransferase enzyme family protein [Pedobacter sp. SYP-B3415]|uniref:phosphotransferase enzyme family protein n=1 Tax=Pedobacter sp. SYP-B3415 TaxID=2496641 RepID=UPI00101C4BC0|nr:aminoglycoside phosphotransferase family protein [Pedobacter sp. SYP-B3415]